MAFPPLSPIEGEPRGAHQRLHRLHPHPHYYPGPPAARFLSKQTLGGGDCGGPAECQGNPGNKPKQTLRGPPGLPRGSVRSHQQGRGGRRREDVPFPEPRWWWEAAGRAVAGSGPARCTQRPSRSDPAASGARRPRPAGHPSWLLGARAPHPRGTAVRGQTRGLRLRGSKNPGLIALALASQD